MAVKPAEVETKRAKGQVLEAQYMKGKQRRRGKPAYVQMPRIDGHGHAPLKMVIHEGKSDEGVLLCLSRMPPPRSHVTP